MWLAVFTIIVFMSLLYVLNRILNLPTTINNDISGWYSLILSSAIGIYITFAILIYSDASQAKISEIITKENERDEKRKKFAMEMIGRNLIGQTSILAGIRDKT